jgi:hypothetical protein
VAAQQSVLMVCPDPVTVPVSLPDAIKIEIPHKNCFTLLKRLDACGINAKSLFADLDGLGRHLDWIYSNGWMLPYRRV